jgi:hypothetical protein
LTGLKEKAMWGQAEKLGKGTRVNYDPSKKMLTFCFNRGPDKSGEDIRRRRVALLKELETLGYIGRMKYNGEVFVEDVEDKNVVLIKKNHKLVVRLNQKQSVEKEEEMVSDSDS